MLRRPALLIVLVALAGQIGTDGARAQMALNEVVVEFQPGALPREDIEVTNTGEENLYLQVEPREVLARGRTGRSASSVPIPTISACWSARPAG
ncbi:hypothetical protein D3874_12910 [Oleomonas cavernae]|uniref:Molecular chaperone n=1 Tax=Oleomonas cavernae TaxID=2320859 RepID=A0A418WCQ8_9PROT|nr:hypothetical protein [Oleomonas cavernae]RJF87813.1 hypothetical protein D3874_12910 [Oleomonas cavernae]